MGIIETLLDYVSIKLICTLLGVVWALRVIYHEVDETIRLRKLGAPGTLIKTRVPFGLGIIYRQVTAAMNDKSYEGFLGFLNGSPNYTALGRFFSNRMVCTADPEIIKAMLATQFSDFGKGWRFHRDWCEFLGDSIFTTDGDLWHASRQLIRPQFSRERISDLQCFESHLESLFKAIANGGVLNGEHQHDYYKVSDGKRFDISDLFYRFTLDVTTDFLLGMDPQSLNNPHQPFADAFNEVQRLQGILSRAGPLKPFMSHKVFRQGIQTINEFCNIYIEQALRLSPEELANKTKSDQGYTFLHELASFTRDRKVLRDQLISVLLAGRDTTAATLSWTFYELARHPEVVRKLRREILDQVGPHRTPTYADLKSMKYLQNVINETLRLYPSVPFNVRAAFKDTTLPRGGGPDGTQPLSVLKETSVGYSVMVMQRRADLYPAVSEKFADPLVFSPERWFTWQPKPWQYIPFNGGPRICIGQQFALTEISYVLTRLFQRYERVDNYMHEIDGGNPKIRTDIVIQPGDGVWIGLWEAKRGEV